jgi:hypothetical protein
VRKDNQEKAMLPTAATTTEQPSHDYATAAAAVLSSLQQVALLPSLNTIGPSEWSSGPPTQCLLLLQEAKQVAPLNTRHMEPKPTASTLLHTNSTAVCALYAMQPLTL